jgi:hypothetical protein
VLEGKIQIGTDLRLVSPEGNEPLGHVGRVHIEHSNPFEPFDPAKPLQESGEGGRRSQIPPIIAQILGHQNQFLDSPTCQFLRLSQEGRQGLALQISSNGGYHTIGAEVSATFRDLQISIMRRSTKQARKAHGILEGARRKGRILDLGPIIRKQTIAHLDDFGSLAYPYPGVHLRHLICQILTEALGEATHDHQGLAGTVFLEAGHLQDRLDGFFLGGLNEGAGVD